MPRTTKIDINGLGGSFSTETLTLYYMQLKIGPPLSNIQQWNQSDDRWKLELDEFNRSVLDKEYVSVGTTLNDAVEVWKIIAKVCSN